ncbi:Sugar transport protein mst8 [Stylosanthes scabra]|uniref:Sugar transport protein mst8 n=1 Tax=Stylosanthes scabra TaxID=79078 RepID=A0ABU6ZEL3_9FABA|nr:Sugar transport protein mst8 [Stylosanthes scabra]
MICIVASFGVGGLIFGYGLGITGGVSSMDTFLEEFFSEIYEKEVTMKLPKNEYNAYCKFDSQILTLFTSSLYLAALPATISASFVTQSCGRRVTMLCSGVFFLAGAGFSAFAQNVWMLIIGRISGLDVLFR